MSQWPLRKAYLWQEAPFLRLLLPLALGICSYDAALPSTADYRIMLGILAISVVILAATAFSRNRVPIVGPAYAIILPIAFMALGWCAYATSDDCNTSNWYGKDKDTTALQLVRVATEAQPRSKTTRYTVELITSVTGGRITPLSGHGLLYIYNTSQPAPISKGDTVLIPSKWQAIQNSGNPFEFDNARFQHRRGIDFQQFLPLSAVAVYGRNNNDQRSLESIHQWCNRQLYTYIHDTTTLSLLQAMLLGDESNFDTDLRQAYSQTGVIHIVSISGSHVAVLFLVVTSLLFWMKGPRGIWVKYGIGVVLVWLYVLMAGAPPSALRSAIMFSIIALSLITGNENHSLNTLLAAAFILLVAEPSWLFSVGFQLSFGAVLSMLLFYKQIYRLLPQSTWAGRKIWQATVASIAAEILTAPLVIYYFHNFPLLSIIANLLSAVLVGICALVGGMSIIVLCGIPPLAKCMAWLVTYSVLFFNKAIVFLQSLNPTSLQYLQITLAELLIIYLLISGVYLLLVLRKKCGIFIALGSACLLFGLLTYDQFIVSSQERLIVYNNGKHAKAELMRGRRYQDILTKEKETAENYNIKAAHIGWQAWRRNSADMYEQYMTVNRQRVLVLSDTAINRWQKPWPVDILIICRTLKGIAPDNIFGTFHPHQLVLALPPEDYNLRKWRESCRSVGVAFHAVSEDGAYILE